MTPKTDLDVTGSRSTVRLSAVIDTGFDGYVCIPTTAAVRLGLELAGMADVELADGTESRVLFFNGSATFLGETRSVYIY